MAISDLRDALRADSIEVLDLLGSGPLPYLQVLEDQRSIHKEVVRGERDSTLLLLEHTSIFTAGKRTEDHERPITASPVIDVDRGGKITWHGPGQLVGYPIIRLRNPEELVGFVRVLEGAIIDSLDAYGIEADRVAGRSGVWIEGRRKIAAIGIRVAQGVAMHGFAVNVNCSLAAYDEIIPCGIDDAEVTSISKELGREVTIAHFLPTIKDTMTIALQELI